MANRMSGMLRLLYIILLSIALAACSRVKFAYHQLDWLIPYYVDNYIELTASQDSYLESEVEKLLQWHCGAHLTSYADLLRSAIRHFQQDAMDAAQLRFTLGEIEGYWKEIKRQASPAIANLFLSSEAAQLEEFFSGLEERNSAWLTEFNSQSDEALRKDYRERMIDELERWFGPLTLAQQQLVMDWSRRFKPLGLQGLQARRQWQARVRSLLDRRNEEEVLFAAIEVLFVNPDSGQPAEYLSRLEHNQGVTIEMLAQVSGQLTAVQKQHLDGMAGSVAADFDQLACTGEKPASKPAKDPHPADILLGPF